MFTERYRILTSNLEIWFAKQESSMHEEMDQTLVRPQE